MQLKKIIVFNDEKIYIIEEAEEFPALAKESSSFLLGRGVSNLEELRRSQIGGSISRKAILPLPDQFRHSAAILPRLRLQSQLSLDRRHRLGRAQESGDGKLELKNDSKKQGKLCGLTGSPEEEKGTLFLVFVLCEAEADRNSGRLPESLRTNRITERIDSKTLQDSSKADDQDPVTHVGSEGSDCGKKDPESGQQLSKKAGAGENGEETPADVDAHELPNPQCEGGKDELLQLPEKPKDEQEFVAAEKRVENHEPYQQEVCRANRKFRVLPQPEQLGTTDPNPAQLQAAEGSQNHRKRFSSQAQQQSQQAIRTVQPLDVQETVPANDQDKQPQNLPALRQLLQDACLRRFSRFGPGSSPLLFKEEKA